MKKLIAAVTLLAVSTAQADIIYVDASCPGPGDGSELDPYCSIQTAIDNAVDTDEVVVAPGTYFETIDFLGKAIWLHSSDGAEVTTIDGTGFFHVVQCVTGEGPDTVLDGFTITGGNADGTPGSDRNGGGMLNEGSSPTVTNCTFTANSADAGGGMANEFSSPTVEHCTFIANSADVGGGMATQFGSPTVIGCTFRENQGEGGGMVNSGDGSPTIVDCIFSGNVCTQDDGGGMNNSEGSSPIVINCTFDGNISIGGGAGIDNEASSPTMINCMFIGNIAATEGGGMLNWESSAMVINCTFANNSANAGGGMDNEFSNPIVTNCILWGNTGGEIRNHPGSPIVTYCDVQGGYPGTGNIDADPMFVDPDNGDFRLQAGSPCIDAGNNWAIVGLTDTDLDGNPRFADDMDTDDSGCGVPVVVDMGAYEFQGDPFPVKFGDIDGDGIVGIIDFLRLLAAWGPCPKDCCLADLDIDGDVGITDFLLLLANWG